MGPFQGRFQAIFNGAAGTCQYRLPKVLFTPRRSLTKAILVQFLVRFDSYRLSGSSAFRPNAKIPLAIACVTALGVISSLHLGVFGHSLQ
jgi:hypothetical protein